MEKLLHLYKYVDGVNDSPFPSKVQQAILYKFKYDAKRMGNVPTITGTLMYPQCLDNEWGNGLVYVTYNGERYFLRQTPTSSYSNEDTRYKHEVDFVSERIVLNDVYFYDVVASDVSNDKPVSNSSNVTFFGDIHEFAQRLNYSLQYANVGYSVVVDEGITSEGKLVSFQDQFFANALQEIYNTYEIPYYFVGKVIHIGYTNNAITHTFKYGVNDALLSIQKTNANYKITNRVTGIGSADNIPYYYPNKDEKGSSKALYNNSSSNITIENESLYKKVKLSDVFTYTNLAKYTHTITNGEQYSFDNELTETSANIWELWQVHYPFTIDKISEYVDFDIDYIGSDFRFINIELWNGGQRIATYNKRGKFTRKCGLGDYEFRIGLGIYSEEHLPKSYADTIISKIKVSATQEIESEIGWYLNDKRYTIVQLSDYGLKVSTTPKDGDKITFEQIGYIKPQMNLMPPIYRESNGSERFYNALNKTYISPQTSEYYTFDNPYVEGKPKEHIVTFDDIKPSIVGITNASGQRIDMFSEFAYDANDNDEFDEEGNYLHPYFFGKLRKFDGTYGFNLFDHAIEEDEMVISMTSGSCGACNFIIGVDEETQKNIVQVDENGKLLRDANGNVLFGSPQERQNDTSKYEVWVALKKDIDTFGVIMPNASGNYKPKAGDTFVILHIDLPYGYIVAAEDRLKEQIIKYMAMNNSEKFTFSITFSRIFFAENPTILAQLDENARLQIEYNGKEYELYVSSYSYSMNDDNPLPEIRVELSDTLTISQNALQNAISEVKGDIMSSVGSIDWAKIGLKYFLRKDVDDRAKGKIASDTALEVGKFVSGASGAIIYVDKTTGQTIAELDKLYVRMKAYFEQLEIVNVNSVGGKQILSPAGALRLSNVVDNGGDYYRCYFLNEQDGESVENRFAIGDQAYCQLFNAKSGVNNNISNKYYWRLVVGVGEDYIDLSKNDCDNGSDIPSVGDVVCHKGNRNDVDRQNLIEFSSVDSYSPSIILYQGVNSYSLSGKDLVSFGVDKTTNKAFMNVYGDMYVGNRNETSYMRYTQEKGLEIKGKLAVGTTLSDGRDLEQAIKDAKPENYEEFVEQVTKEFEAIRNEMDGAIDTWFGDETPTLNNYPAVDWVTNADKDSHLGDLFYANDGKAYRFQYTQDSGYYWAVIEDSEVVKALELAQKALDTADGKRRVFIEQPFPPYDLGDLWAGGSEQPLKRCINAKGENGSYSAEDWALADDSHAYADAVKDELQGSISDTTDALNKAISDAQKAANTYTDDAKTTIQNTITTLEKAKANVDDVYTKSQADEEISRAEQDAIKAAQEAADAAIVLANETVMAYADGIVTAEEEARIKQAEENLEAANKYAKEKAQEAFNNASDLIAGYSYLREALKESTTVDGGLIQSALLMLGYTTNGSFKVMSGTNGIYKANEKGGGIAAWYGGPMADKEANNALTEYAQSLFRFDGSGYLAGGNISWDKDGAGKVAGGDLSWDKNGVITLGSSIRISGDTSETLSSILAFINEYRNLWTYDATNNAVRTTLNLIVDEAISFGGVGSGGGSTGGITALSALSDVALGTLLNGDVLTWNGSKWVNKAISSGLDITAMWNALATVDNTKVIDSSHIPDLSGKYLSVSGGTIYQKENSIVPLAIRHSYPYISYQDASGTQYGYLGFNGINSLVMWEPDATTARTIYHSGNFNPSDYLPKSGGTLSSNATNVVTLNSLSPSDTGVYLRMEHNSIKVGEFGHGWGLGTYILANDHTLRITNSGIGYLNDNLLIHSGNYTDYALPKTGGTLTGPLTLSSGASSAYDKTALSFIRTLNSTEQARIGTDNSGGIGVYSVGNIYLRGNVTLGEGSTNGVVIYKDWLSFNANAIIHEGNYSTTTDNRYLQLTGGTIIGNLNITSGNIGIYDNAGNGILAPLSASNTWTGVSGEAVVVVGSSAYKTVIRTNADNLYHYNLSAGKQYKIYDSGNLTKETLGVYARTATVNGTSWNITGTTNAPTTFDIYAPTTKGSSGQFLRSSGTGAPIWENIYWYDSSISRTANTVLAAPNGSNGVATFRALVAADIPTVNTVLCQEGTSNVNRPIVLTNKNNGLGYAPRTLVNYVTGDITLYSESGDSPALIFQRGAIDDYTTTFDWKTFVSGGDLYFQTNYNGWATKFKIDYYGEGYIDKLTVENSILTKEIYFAANEANGTKYSQYGNPVMGPNSIEWGVYSSSSKGLFLVNNNGNVSIGTDTYKGYIFEVDGAGKNIMFSSEVSPILKLKRTGSSGGAYIDYYSANSETHGWRVGHNVANEFVFAKYQNNVEKAIPLTIKESIIQALCGFMLSTTDGSAFNNYGVIFGNYLGRIGASNAGDIGIYASNGIYLRPASGSANSAIGVVIYQTGDVTMSHGLTVSSNIYTNGDIILNDTTGTSSISRKLKFLRRTESDDYWDYGLYAQSTKGLTFYQSANGVNTDIAYLDGYGNFVVTGAITFGSDARYKTKLSDATIDLETIANAPLFNYKWNDREDNKEHLGTTAQYWSTTAFKNAVCPTNDEKLWTMSYSEIAVGGMITIARELIPVKSDVALLKERVEKLERILIENNIKFE